MNCNILYFMVVFQQMISVNKTFGMGLEQINKNARLKRHMPLKTPVFISPEEGDTLRMYINNQCSCGSRIVIHIIQITKSINLLCVSISLNACFQIFFNLHHTESSQWAMCGRACKALQELESRKNLATRPTRIL